MPIIDFVELDERGFDVPESIPLEEYGGRFPLPLKIERVGWCDSSRKLHELDAKELLIRVLPDRSGLICLETPKSIKGRYVGQSGAFVLNEDASLRYRLQVPAELANRDVSTDSVRYFVWVEHSKERNQYGLTAVIADAGEYYFELDYHTGRFLSGTEIRF